MGDAGAQVAAHPRHDVHGLQLPMPDVAGDGGDGGARPCVVGRLLGRLAGHRLRLASAQQAGPASGPSDTILTDGVPARTGGRENGAPPARMCAMQELLRDLARVVLADRTLEEILQEITSLASTGIPGAEATSITLVRNDKAFTAAYDGEMALAADELQYEQGYGPRMDAGRGGVVLRSTTSTPSSAGPSTCGGSGPTPRYAAHCPSRCPTRAPASGP